MHFLLGLMFDLVLHFFELEVSVCFKWVISFAIVQCVELLDVWCKVLFAKHGRVFKKLGIVGGRLGKTVELLGVVMDYNIADTRVHAR